MAVTIGSVMPYDTGCLSGLSQAVTAARKQLDPFSGQCSPATAPFTPHCVGVSLSGASNV